MTSLIGIISEVHFTALSNLKGLSISGTSLSFHVNSTWTPPFQLEFLIANSYKTGPKFPAWLQTQKSLSFLDFSGSGIVDTTPNWFWKFASYIQLDNTIIDLRSNKFNGIIPPQIGQLSSLIVLDIADNSLSGSIPKCLNNISAMTARPIRGIWYDALEADCDYESYMESLVLDMKGRESKYENILKYVRMIDLSSNNLSVSKSQLKSQVFLDCNF